MVQRRVARFVCNNYNQRAIVTDMLRDLDWDSLEHRREVARVDNLPSRKPKHLLLLLDPVVPHPQKPTFETDVLQDRLLQVLLFPSYVQGLV